MRERYESGVFQVPWVRYEHQARYDFAANFVSGKQVVDAACGDGTGSAVYLNSGASAVQAFDKDGEAIEKARKRHGSRAGLEFFRSDCLSLDVTDHAVDVFISLETIEHLQDDRGFLREVARILRPSGLFICSTPNRSVTNPGTTLETKPFNPFHIREYSEPEFRALLENYFLKVDLYGQNRTGPLLMSLVNGLRGFLPLWPVLWLQRVWKARQFIGDSVSAHGVKKGPPGTIFEYMVAVCSNPS